MKTVITARYAETDQMGIIHHSVYPVWYEVARTEFIREAGLPYSEMEKAGVMLPVIEVNCKYKSPFMYEDRVEITTSISLLTPSKIQLEYVLQREGEEHIRHIGTTLHPFTNTNLKPINMKKHFPEIYKIFENIYNK